MNDGLERGLVATLESVVEPDDGVGALADAIRAFDDPVVDLVDVFGVPAHPELQGPDGVYPSLAGQQRIVTALVETLTA